MDGPGRKGEQRHRSGQPLKLEDAIASAIEFLISQGHSFRDIKSYSLPQVMLFMRLSRKRLEIEHGLGEGGDNLAGASPATLARLKKQGTKVDAVHHTARSAGRRRSPRKRRG